MSAKSTEEQPNLPGTIFSVAREVEALGVEALPFKCNVLNPEEIEAMVDATIKKWGRYVRKGSALYSCVHAQGVVLIGHRVDIMVNNAGALWWKKMIDTPVKRYV